MGYTLGQFRRYVELAQWRESRQLRGQVLAALAGNGGKFAERLLKALEDQS